jgi:hypothetical protein
VNDAEWKRFRMEDERKSLLIEIDRALDDVPGVEAAELDEEFTRCLDRGGVDAVYAFTEKVDVIFLPVFYPLVTEYFIRARVAPVKLPKPKRTRRAKQLLKLAETLAQAGLTARNLSNVPRWCTSLSGSLCGFAAQLLRLANEDIAIHKNVGPGRPMEVSTSFALSLNDVFRGRKVSMMNRCDLIAGVVSAFVEPVDGEQIRQRIKDLRRRPRSSGKR